MLSENPYVRLYIKRVIREVPFDSDHAYIQGEITAELEAEIKALHEKTPHLAVPALLKTMEDPSSIAKRFRNRYGFTTKGLMLFNQTMIYASVAVLYMATAFVVFRLFPLREFWAYGVCGAAALYGAKIAYRQFFPLRHVVFSSFLPPFLLLFYPMNNAYQAAVRGRGALFPLFFSQTNRVPLVLSALFLLLFLLPLGFMYVRTFRKAWPKHKSAQLLTGLSGISLLAGGMILYGTFALQAAYTKDAGTALSALSAQAQAYVFDQSSPASPSDTFLAAAETLDIVTQTYIGIQVPAHKQPAPSAAAAVSALTLFAQGPDALVSFYHTGYTPRPERPFPAEKLAAEAEKLAFALQAVENNSQKGLSGAISVQRALDAAMTAFRTNVRLLYEEWIFQNVDYAS